MKAIKCYWDFELDCFTVVTKEGKKMAFTKQWLTEVSASQLADTLLSFVKSEPVLAKPKPHAYQIAILCLPGMRQRWFKKTQGSISSPPFNEEQTIGFFMSQGFTLKLPKVIFEDERFSHIDLILDWLANNWMHLKGISGYDYTVDASTYYELNFEWANIQKKLHVYDMGEGMLVPCELVHDIVVWLNEGKQGWWMSKEMIDDDLYGEPAMAGVKAIAAKIDNLILEKQTALQVSPYLTDKSAWLVNTNEPDNLIVSPQLYVDLMNFIKGSEKYGMPLEKYLNAPAPITIPKKPKQITKESLEYFHKLLGGKKSPF